jgi:Flp pilus assembly protein TadG
MKHRSERGQSLVETAFVLPVLLLLLFGIFDFGRAVYAYNILANSAREATRLAIVDQNLSSITAEAHETSIGLDPASVNVTFATCPAPVKIGCPATVTLEYQWTAITPIIGSIVGQIDLASTAEMPIERVYVSP